MNGILNIYKPPGRTSFSVVTAVKKICNERRVGHAGTLDPLAEGVLPLLLGRATRVAEYLLDAKKTYRAEIEFGKQTDTGDAEGKVIASGDVSFLDQDKIVAVLNGFRGRIRQTPPMYSALKYRGQPLYKYAREGIIVPRPEREVEIDSLEMVSWDLPVATIEVGCSHGTYIRTLAEDIGRGLGCGAMVRKLVRLRCGPFEIGAAISLDRLTEAAERQELLTLLYPPDSVMQQWPVLVASPQIAADIRHGKPVSVEITMSGDNLLCRSYTLDGNFLGVLRFNPDTGEWLPEKIFC